MGILNVTPDSFSDGGRFVDVENALSHARRMAEEGAAVIDVGGESTRPGSEPVPTQQELDRVIPVIEALRDELLIPVSIDTSKPEVMRAAIAAGAGFINDVYALRMDDAVETVADLGVPVCLMHMLGEPRSMQSSPEYEDVITNVRSFLLERARLCEASGIKADNIIIDPGFGFGKTLAHNLTVLARLEEFTEDGYPLLIGVSRKSMFGMLLDAPVEDRLHASIAAEMIALSKGARIIRAHDVKPAVDAVKLQQALVVAGR